MSINWSRTQADFKGQWVALDDDEATVLAHGNTARDALQQARERGHPHPILTHMPATLDTYIGAA